MDLSDSHSKEMSSMQKVKDMFNLKPDLLSVYSILGGNRLMNLQSILKIRITEKKFQSQIVQLAKLYGWTVYHTYDSRRSEPGFPDLVLVRETVLFRELKTDDGKLTPAQKAWGDTLKKAGANYAVWRPSMAQEINEEIRGR